MKIVVKRKRLIFEMAKKFINQKDLAEKLEITPQALNAILKGRNGTSLETAEKICKVFECNFEDLFVVNDSAQEENNTNGRS